jgi:hypothetical protein
VFSGFYFPHCRQRNGRGKIIHRGTKEGHCEDKMVLKDQTFFKHQKDYDTGKTVPSENPLKGSV